MPRSATAYRIVSDSTHDNDAGGEHLLLDAHVRPFALRCVGVVGADVLHANDDDDDDDADRTLTVSAEENAHLLRRAFGDDEITREVLAPPIPAGVPSPLGDDDRATARGEERPRADGATLTSLFEDEDDKPTVGCPAFANLPTAPSPPTAPPPPTAAAQQHAQTSLPTAPHLPAAPPLPAASERARTSLALRLPTSARRDLTPELPSIHRRVSPHAFETIRAAREAARSAKAHEARTRLVVFGIWGLAVTLGGLLAFVALLP